MDIKQLRFLIALARERHFGRAAEACYVSQPTLSARIRQLEDDLGVMLVVRAQHSYRGLTPEGERVLRWATRIVADCDAMRQAVSAMQDRLTGAMTLGVVPSALPFVPLLTEPFCQRHPQVTTTVLSLSSIEIQRGLDNYELEVGVTYIDNEPLSRVRILPLYQERYRLLIADTESQSSHMSWAEAGRLPLCLLTQDMQYRRIIDSAFRSAGVEPDARVETNSVTTLYAQVRLGHLATVLPDRFLQVMGISSGIRSIPLQDPDIAHGIGLVASDREPPSPLAQALFEIGSDIDLSAALGETQAALS